MYTNYNYSSIPFNSRRPNNQNDRLIGGGFLGPFVLGGITGGLLAPAFYPRRPYYNNYYYPYPVNYYYGGYYR